MNDSTKSVPVFEQPPARVEEVLRLICHTATGRQFIDRLMPHHRSGRIRFEPYPATIVVRLRESVGPDQPIGAAFSTDGEAGIIHYDPKSPLGVLAPFILHEIVHSLDEALWEAARIPQKRMRREQLMLRAESIAFEAQHRFQGELAVRYPTYSEFLRMQSAKARILVEQMLESDIMEHYGLGGSA
jgi:hypothetical protein